MVLKALVFKLLQDARATNYAKLMQTQSPPKDCEYEDLGFKDSVSYFFRIQLFGCKLKIF